MLGLRSYLLTILLSSRVSAVAFATDSQLDEIELERQQDEAAFQRLLDEVDPPALHSALHNYSPKKFKHGAFNGDRVAAEAIHHDDPALATTIVSIARRQDTGTNSTAVVVSPPDTSTPIGSDPAAGPTEEPATSTVVLPGSPESPPVVTVTTGDTAPSSPSVPVSVSTPSISEPSIPSDTSTPAESSPSIPSNSPPPSSEGSTPETTSATAPESNTEASSAAITSAAASTSLEPSSSERPSTTPRSRRTSLVLQTVTAQDGAQSTLTAITEIEGGGAAATSEASAAGTTTADGALQSQGSVPNHKIWGWEAIGVVGGAIGVAMVI